MATEPLRVKARLGKPEKKELFDLYWRQLLNEAQIADMFNVEPETVLSWIIREDIPLKGYYESLQLSYFLSGGILASTRTTLQHVIPFDCVSTEIVLHFPSGCNGLVQVYVTDDKGFLYFPTKGSYVALDNVTQSFQFVTFFPTGTKLRVVITNTDSAFSHDVQAIISISRLSVQGVA